MPFKHLGLINELLKAIESQGYDKPTPVQEQSIPIILQGHDILAGSQTGTGKTASFTLPILQKLYMRPKAQGTRAIGSLILVPTRELAAQVAESVQTYGKNLPLKSFVVFGGVNINPQIHALRNGVDILVATPGRLLDLVGQKVVDLSKVEILVLDEADRMLDMGFVPDIRRILKLLPRKRQNLLFSATFSQEIKTLAEGFLVNPKLLEVTKPNSTTELVSQVIHPVDGKRKKDLLAHLIKAHDWKQVLVFTRTKHGANKLAQHLDLEGINSAAIHGNKSQSARTRALADFKNGLVKVLVATDIAARGLDISQLPHVVNYELPNVPEDYVHRIGRTGRAGNEGEAVSLVCIDEHAYLRDIERLLKREIPKVVIEGYQPDPNIRAEPILRGRPQQAPRRRTTSGNAPTGNGPRANGPAGKRPQDSRKGKVRFGVRAKTY